MIRFGSDGETSMASQGPRLCPVCKLFRPKWRRRLDNSDRNEPPKLHRHFKQRPLSRFLDSARSGCPGCTMITDALEAWQPGWIDSHRDGTLLRLKLFDSSLKIVIAYPPYNQPGDILQLFQSQSNSIDPLVTIPFYSTRGVVADTRSEAALKRIRSWVENCTRHHKCSTTGEDAVLPTRILDIQKKGNGGQDDVICLVENPVDVPYVALSYCWGADLTGVLRTLKDNKSVHKQGILVLSLPQTVQDAIIVCRGLGARYLWVDALCIVQDDKDDWKHEATRMKNVYQCSWLTIAAHAAASCKDGFLGPQTFGQSGWQCEFSTRFDAPTAPRKMFVRAGEPPFWGKEARRPVLQTRGWTLQEAVLPRRILHFIGDEMVWECEERHFCECGHTDGMGIESPCPMVKTELERGIDGLQARKNLTLLRWMDLVERYTQRTLTNTSDKLVAIRGLAEMVATESQRSNEVFSMDSMYFYGIFHSRVVTQLLWAVKDPQDIEAGSIQPVSSRPSPYRAPTWSWASVDGPVEYQNSLKRAYESEDFGESNLKIFAFSHGSREFPGDVPSSGCSWSDLTLQGLVAPVALLTAERPFDLKRSNIWDDISDNFKGRASVVRLRSGKSFEIICDESRVIDMSMDDAAYECWVPVSGRLSGNGEDAPGEGKSIDSDEMLLNDTDHSGDDNETNADPEDFEGIRGAWNAGEEASTSGEDYGSEGKQTGTSGGDSGWDSEDNDESGEGVAEALHEEEDYCQWCDKCGVGDTYWDDPEFCVLRMAAFDMGEMSMVFFLVLRRSVRRQGCWERVGMGSFNALQYEHIDDAVLLFEDARVEKLRMV